MPVSPASASEANFISRQQRFVPARGGSRAIFLATLLLGLSLVATPAAAGPDEVTLGTAVGPPGATIDVPVFVRDVSGSKLNVNTPGNRIQGWSFKVSVAPAAAVATVSWKRGGLTANLSPNFEQSTPPTFVAASGLTVTSFLANFADLETIQYTLDKAAPGDIVAFMSVRIAESAAPGASIAFSLLTESELTNAGGTVSEFTGDGSLVLRNGTVTVGSALTVQLAPASASVVAGSTATLTVTISGPQDVPTVIDLTSSSSSATVPATVTLPAGQTSGTFTVTGVSAGSATIQARLTGLGGATATSAVTVTAPCTLNCTATVPTTGAPSAAVAFASTATPSNCGAAPAFSWAFGDGGTSTQQNPSYTYASAGTFSWTLTVTTSGQTCTRNGSITIAQACSISCTATAPPTVTVGMPAPFSITATPSNCGAAAVSYTFDYGDGGGASPSTTPSQNHTYQTAGTFNWTVTATVSGQTCTRQGSITVSAACAVSCSASVSPTATRGTTVAFAGSATPTNCVATPAYSWNFGDSTPSSSLQNPSHVYSLSGSYTWTLTVTTGTVICTRSGTVTISDPPPTCLVSCTGIVPLSATAGSQVEFTAIASASNCNPSQLSYAWTFGDGTSATGVSVTHPYTTPGTYSWSLTASVANQDGSPVCTRGGQITIGSEPEADLSISLLASPDPVGPGADLTYTAAVTNRGPVQAANVSVAVALGAGVTNPTVTADGWTCGTAGTAITCTRAALATGSAPAIVIRVKAPAATGTVNASATVTSQTRDTVTSNNQATRSVTVTSSCPLPARPEVSVVGEVESNQPYKVTWPAVPGASAYELQESSSADFGGSTIQTVAGTSFETRKEATTPKQFFYQVRAISSCNQTLRGEFSIFVRITIQPPQPPAKKEVESSAALGSQDVIVQRVQIFPPVGKSALNSSFTAASDKPFITVTPSSGTIPPGGTTLTVTTNPSNLPVGTTTGTIVVATPGTPAPITSVPVSVTLGTPVTPAPLTPVSGQSLIIPSVSRAQLSEDSSIKSDIRITNSSTQKSTYELSLVLATGTSRSRLVRFASGAALTAPATVPANVLKTTIEINAGQTVAVDDVVRRQFGIGGLGESATGSVEIKPRSTSGKLTLDEVGAATVATSRTFTSTSRGSLGQFVASLPAVAAISRAAAGVRPVTASLQQILNTPTSSTNLGIVEVAQQPALVSYTIFDAQGQRIEQVTKSLRPGEHLLFNPLAGRSGLNLLNGRIEVSVGSGEGRITSYATVTDSATRTSSPISPITSATSSSVYLLMGMTDSSSSQVRAIRSDITMHNPSTSTVTGELAFFPEAGAVARSSFALNAGETKTFADALRTIFNAANQTGMVKVSTSTPSSLAVSARRLDTRSTAFGDFIAAIDGRSVAGLADKAIQVQQMEESDRYTTDLNLAEVSGNSATVELTVVDAGSAFASVVTVNLAANEYKSMKGFLKTLPQRAYNARVAVKVTGGTGRVASWATLNDVQSGDPTYIPGQ